MMTHLAGNIPVVPDVGAEVVPQPLAQQTGVQHQQVHHGQHDEVDSGVGPPHGLAAQHGDGKPVAQRSHRQQDWGAHLPHLHGYLPQVER